MKDFASLADEEWRFLVDEYDLNSVMIGYPDPDRRGAFVGPLATVNIGCTSKNEFGDEILELDGADGRNLYAIACLPHIAALFEWIRNTVDGLGVSENDEYNEFVDLLRHRIDWISGLIDERDMEIGADSGPVGFTRF